MKNTSASNPHFDHLFKISVLHDRRADPATRDEAEAELLRYHNAGLIIQEYGREKEQMTKQTRAQEPKTFSGQGIIFAVIDDREAMRTGRVTTIDVIAEAIEGALDAGHEDSASIARYLTTSSFQHIEDKRIRFNSILVAGDAVGAQITRKLYNAYNELAQLAEDEVDPQKKADIRNEATGFAEALNVVFSPFSTEDPEDPRLVNWDEVDRITTSFEKEQRLVRKERNGRPQ